MPTIAGGRAARVRRTVASGILIMCLGSAAVAAAPEEGPDQPGQTAGANADFWFGSPGGWVAVRGGWLALGEEGDIFTFLRDTLTIEQGDFAAPALGVEAGVLLHPRVGVGGGVDISRRSVSSEYRRFVDNQGLPINQRTRLLQVNLTGSVKVALLGRGRRVSQLAFVPRTVVPYAGAGVGLLRYDLQQTGDFVDFATLDVFSDTFGSSGWTPSSHVFGGAEFRVWRSLFLDVEGRYVWAHAELGSDFVGFDGIDLDGFRLSSGVSLVF